MPEASGISIGRFFHRLNNRSLLGARRHEHQRVMADVAFINASGQFDRPGYLQRYPDVARDGIDPVLHYVLRGALEGRNPTTWFDTDFYLRNYPDIATSGTNPFRHFIEHGKGEGRAPAPAAPKAKSVVAKVDDAIANNQEIELIRHSGFFDPAWYLKKNPDVASVGMSPLRHFTRYGWKELRDPSPQFNMAWYWLTQQAQAGIEGNPLAHYLTRTDAIPKRNLLRPAGKLTGEDKKVLVDTCAQLLPRDDLGFETLSRISRALIGLSNWELAEDALRKVVELAWNTAAWHCRLAKVLARRGLWWQAVESLERAVELDPSHAEWYFWLGEAQEQMNRFALAAQAFGKCVELEPARALGHYRLGYCLERSGQAQQAESAYAKAIELRKNERASRLGIGYFHQERGRWDEAAAAYAKRASAPPLDALVHYSLGMAYDQCYRWDEAVKAYRTALSLDPVGTPYWHYRYGFVLERQQRWMEASRAYGAASQLSTREMPDWRYRQGYVLAEAGCHELACLAFLGTRRLQTVDGQPYVPDSRLAAAAAAAMIDTPNPASNASERAGLAAYLESFGAEVSLNKALAEDFTDAQAHYRLGEARELKRDWDSAARAYADAVARNDSHNPGWYYRLGFALFRAGRFEEAVQAFRQTSIIQKPYGMSMKGLAAGSGSLKLATHYAEYLETLPIQDKVIMYESHLGKLASCNPLAMFRHLSVHPDYQSYLHVWTIDDANNVPADMRRMPNVAIVTRQSDLYVRYVATAKYFINNSILPQYFVRRPEQKYLATWHGTPLKTLGKQQQYKFQEHKRAQRNFLQATHIISPNPHTTDVLFDSYDLRPIMGGKLAETGYPRIDLTLNASERRREEIRKAVGVAGGRPVVLYAPTWRGTLETVSYEVERAKSDIARLAESHDCDIIFRGHHLIEQYFQVDDSMGCVVAPAAIDTNELLSIVDVLVTDYSSIFFDFLPTGRPVIYYIYDQEEYERERGLYFSMDEMPGFKCHDLDSLNAALAQALQGQIPDRPQYVQSQRRFNCHDDGDATKRVVDFFFHDDSSFVVDPGPRAPVSLLMQSGGLKRNGITTSFLNLLKAIDRSVAHVTVAISPDVIEFDPEARDSFDRIPRDVAIVARHGLMPMTWEERWLRERFESGHVELNDEQMSIIRHLFDREFRRVFGAARFDVAASFSGYDGLWASILNLCRAAFRKVIYLHNDMVDEYVEKFPRLMQIFRLYHYCDKLVCVCDESNHVNREKLSGLIGIPKDKFTTSENVQDPERIVELSAEAIQAQDEHLFAGGPVFINMARLSVEKDHAKLIRAFSRVSDSHPSARLLILGVGPLEAALRELVRQLGLTDRVHLLGLRSNPYAYLRRSHCFVLSSNHEARCMSLMEALIVGMPCVATDISGNRDIKKDFPEYFFENSEDGLVEGMQRYLAGNLPPSAFDWKKYQNEALRQFESRVLNVVKPPQPTGQLLRINPVLRSNRVVVAARIDGLGERMNALLNGMYLADRLGFDFAYHWSEKGSWEKVGGDSTHHAIEPESRMFSANFIARYSLEKLDRKGLREVSGKGIGADDLVQATLSNDFRGWLAPRVDLADILAPELAPDECRNLKEIFSKIEFSAPITKAIEVANAVKLPAGCVGIHLRSGDIFYGPYRKLVLYSYKGMTIPIAKAIVRELRNKGESAILFGQDKEVMQYIKRETGAMLLDDINKESFESPAAQAIFELVLMSRCNYIVAGSSGFAKQASWIGGIQVKQPKDLLDHAAQTRISMDDLATHADEYHPLQTAFAYWYAYYHGRQFKSADLVDELLKKAAAYDPDNQLYPMKRAFNFYRQERLPDGEAILKKLITDEYARLKKDKLPAFQVLTAKTLSKFNMAEDFESISTAASAGAAYAAACNYVIARAKKVDEVKAFETFSALLGDDPVLNFLHAAWSA
jgi:CDP-glycerol glycerophosphotransferase